MNEEMNRREAELNEQALEGVSGGVDYKYIEAAKSMCSRCGHYGHCDHRPTGLAEYLQQNGIDSVRNPHEDCPYSKC